MINILKKLFHFSSDKLKLKNAFKKIKYELDMHLDSINQNTNEIQNLYEMLLEFERKIDALSEQVERIEIMFNDQRAFDINPTEKAIFKELYLLSESNRFVKLSQLSDKLKIDEFAVDSIINSLIAKGVRIEKIIIDGNVAYSIDPNFKEIQTKNDLLGLNKIER